MNEVQFGDDNLNIYEAAKHTFPEIVIQLCHRHFLRNMKALLDLENTFHIPTNFLLLTKLLIEKKIKR